VASPGTGATVNTGSGGGGGASNGAASSSGAGGSGIVIIAYPDSFDDLTNIGSGLTYSLITARSGYKVYKFTAGSDTITI
jgi:hypothetical protein